jgi:hypothetical protein
VFCDVVRGGGGGGIFRVKEFEVTTQPFHIQWDRELPGSFSMRVGVRITRNAVLLLHFLAEQLRFFYDAKSILAVPSEVLRCGRRGGC